MFLLSLRRFLPRPFLPRLVGSGVDAGIGVGAGATVGEGVAIGGTGDGAAVAGVGAGATVGTGVAIGGTGDGTDVAGVSGSSDFKPWAPFSVARVQAVLNSRIQACSLFPNSNTCAAAGPDGFPGRPQSSAFCPPQHWRLLPHRAPPTAKFTQAQQSWMLLRTGVRALRLGPSAKAKHRSVSSIISWPSKLKSLCTSLRPHCDFTVLVCTDVSGTQPLLMRDTK